MAKYKYNFPGSTGCCLFSLLYFPIGVILELAKNYGSGPSRRRRRY